MLFFFVSCYIQKFFNFPIVREKIRVKLSLAIPTGATIILVNEILHHLLHLKQLKLGQYNRKQLHIYLIFYCMISVG